MTEQISDNETLNQGIGKPTFHDWEEVQMQPIVLDWGLQSQTYKHVFIQ